MDEMLGPDEVSEYNACCIRLQKTADHVIIAVGSESNTDLAESAGLEVDAELGGFVVNSEMSARTDLYAVSTDSSYQSDVLSGCGVFYRTFM